MTYTNEELLDIFKRDFVRPPMNGSVSTLNTYIGYINYLLEFLDNKNILEITKKDIRLYFDSIDVADSTYNGRLSSFKTLFKVLCENPRVEDYIQYNPASTISNVKHVKNKEKVAMSKVEQSMLIKYSKNSRDKAILTTLLNTGMRINECLTLTLEQYINRDDNMIILTETKRDKDRVIFLNDECVKSIDEYLLDRKDLCGKLFVSNQGGQIDVSNMNKTIKVIARRSGYFSDDRVKTLCNHLLRTSFSSTMANDKGISIDILSKILGHSSTAMTSKVYVKTSNNKIMEAMCQS